MKFCKDCKHAYVSFPEWVFSGYRFAKCKRPDMLEIDPVTGKNTYRDTFCSVERYFKCGIENPRFFEEKQSWFTKDG